MKQFLFTLAHNERCLASRNVMINHDVIIMIIRSITVHIFTSFIVTCTINILPSKLIFWTSDQRKCCIFRESWNVRIPQWLMPKWSCVPLSGSCKCVTRENVFIRKWNRNLVEGVTRCSCRDRVRRRI